MDDIEKCDLCKQSFPIVRNETWTKDDGENILIGYTETLISCAETSIGEIDICELCYNNQNRFELFNESDLVEIHTEFGLSYAMEEKYAQAISSFLKGLSYAKTVQLYFGIGNSYSRIGEIEKAEECYIEALKIDPNDYYVKSNLTKLRSENR